MKLEKITDNKIQITLNRDDLNKNNINVHSFMSNSLQSQDLFYLILDKAEKELGFYTDNYKLIIEAISTYDEIFILTITRIVKDSSCNKKNVKAKRKTFKTDENILIYKFDSFDNFCELSNYIFLTKPNLISSLKNSKLFLYNSVFYFIINPLEIKLSLIKNLHYIFLEFSEYINSSKLFEYKLNEYGKLLISNDAIIIANNLF